MQTQKQLLAKLEKEILPLTIEDDLVINGNVIIYNSKLEYLPSGLTINGDLQLAYSKIVELPKTLAVNGSLYIHFTKINLLPECLMVSGRIYHGTGFIYPNKQYIISERIGSRSCQTIYDTHTNMITCGCFYGTLEEFISRVNFEYPSDDTIYKKEYTDFINKIKKHNVF